MSGTGGTVGVADVNNQGGKVTLPTKGLMAPGWMGQAATQGAVALPPGMGIDTTGATSTMPGATQSLPMSATQSIPPVSNLGFGHQPIPTITDTTTIPTIKDEPPPPPPTIPTEPTITTPTEPTEPTGISDADWAQLTAMFPPPPNITREEWVAENPDWQVAVANPGITAGEFARKTGRRSL